MFGPNDVKILDNVKNISADVVHTGEKKGSLFVMAVGEAYVKKTSQTDSTTIWHARLGHLGYQLLRQICSKKLVDGLPALQNIYEDVVLSRLSIWQITSSSILKIIKSQIHNV